jgi:predicted transcriptional regulator
MGILDSNELSQLFEKLLYAIKNKRRRLILAAFNESETLSIKNLREYSIKRGFLLRRTHPAEIKRFYLKPWIDSGVLFKLKEGLFQITDLGKDIKKVISQLKEFDQLEVPSHQKFYGEKILLELRDKCKSYQELTLKLKLKDPKRDVKKLKDKGFLKLNHPKNSIEVSSISYFKLASYYPFIEGLRDFIEKTGRNWFTEYSIITHLNQKWLATFGRPMEINEVQELIKKGMETGAIKKDGSYEAKREALLIPLTASEKKIFDLLTVEGSTCLALAEKVGLHFASVHKLLKRLEKKNLVERNREVVTIDLTEKGRKLADALFKIKEILKKEELRLK